MKATIIAYTELFWRRFTALLSQSVLGQEDVIAEVANAMERRERELSPPRACRGAFVFVGPTGVGKTELAKTVATALFGEGHFARIDVSEFARPDCLAIALGDGVKQSGLIEAMYDSTPSGIWLLDEIEKGPPAFKNLLLQITDAGRLTVASGRVLDFSNIYIIVTANLGTREILEKNLVFTSLQRHVLRSLEEWLNPEFLGRFDPPFVFRPLDWEVQMRIARKRLDELAAWHLQRHKRILTYDDAAVEHILALGFSPRYGARWLIKTIDRLVGKAVIEQIRQGNKCLNGHLVPNGEGLSILSDPAGMVAAL